MTTCPFCERDPFHYVDIGVGMQSVAVDCCEFGDLYFRGARQEIEHDVTLSADEFRALGQKLAELAGYREKYGDLYADQHETIEGASAMREWLIRKSGYFYRPDRRGYTTDPAAAGLYTEDEARTEARVESTISAHHASEFAAQIRQTRADVARFDFIR